MYIYDRDHDDGGGVEKQKSLLWHTSSSDVWIDVDDPDDEW